MHKPRRTATRGSPAATTHLSSCGSSCTSPAPSCPNTARVDSAAPSSSLAHSSSSVRGGSTRASAVHHARRAVMLCGTRPHTPRHAKACVRRRHTAHTAQPIRTWLTASTMCLRTAATEGVASPSPAVGSSPTSPRGACGAADGETRDVNGSIQVFKRVTPSRLRGAYASAHDDVWWRHHLCQNTVRAPPTR